MLDYWLSLTPPTILPNATAWWGVVGVAGIVAAILLRWVGIGRTQRGGFYRQVWRRAARCSATTGAMLLVLLFFRYEGVPFFGARFWLIILAVGDVLWTLAIVRYALVRVPQQRRAWEEEQTRRRYLK